MQCEMCGKDASLVHARVEGVDMDVCPACARFGVRVSKQQAPSRETFRRERRIERERMNLSILLSPISANVCRARASRWD